jgi:hypothetical protein
MRAYRLLVTVIALAPLLACGGETKGMPRAWGPLSLARDERCPNVSGRYVDSSLPIAWLLAGRHVPPDSADADWAWFELGGSADAELHVTVAYADGVEHSGRLTKGDPWNGDYHCDDGWLKIPDRWIPDRWDGELKTDDFMIRRRAMRMAPGADGALVARLDGIDYDEFTVWCGDGCKGIPLPWTFRTRSAWSVAERWREGTPSPRAKARLRDEERREAELQRARGDPVYLEEQRLENGPVAAGQDDARKRVLAALVPGMLARAVAPRDSGWHVSLEFEELWQLTDFMNRLSQSGPVAELKVLPLYRARTTNGRWIDVVYVRYER